jgi:hypothetical protein
MKNLNPLSPVAVVKAHFGTDMNWETPMILGDVPEAAPVTPVTGWRHYHSQNPDE